MRFMKNEKSVYKRLCDRQRGPGGMSQRGYDRAQYSRDKGSLQKNGTKLNKI